MREIVKISAGGLEAREQEYARVICTSTDVRALLVYTWIISIEKRYERCFCVQAAYFPDECLATNLGETGGMLVSDGNTEQLCSNYSIDI